MLNVEKGKENPDKFEIGFHWCPMTGLEGAKLAQRMQSLEREMDEGDDIIIELCLDIPHEKTDEYIDNYLLKECVLKKKDEKNQDLLLGLHILGLVLNFHSEAFPALCKGTDCPKARHYVSKETGAHYLSCGECKNKKYIVSDEPVAVKKGRLPYGQNMRPDAELNAITFNETSKSTALTGM